jgi:hypothetical protein
VGFVLDKVALGQVFPRVLRFSPVNFIPPVLHYKEKRKKNELIICVSGLHNKGCGASVASAAPPFTKKRVLYEPNNNSKMRPVEGRPAYASQAVCSWNYPYLITNTIYEIQLDTSNCL